MRKIIVPLAAVALLVFTLPALAITYGVPDGNDHPNVGALIAEWRTPGVKEEFCSGTLIAPTVFLTASHCTSALQSRGIADHDVWVSFDTDIGDPVRSTTTLIQGTMYTNPEYGFSGPGGFSDPHDIAVIVLDQPAGDVYPGIQPASLPTLGLFDQMGPQGLRGQKFTAVGYGDHEPQIGGGPQVFPFDGLRWRAVSEFDALNGAWLRLSQNVHTGDGGTCYGDSGGPNFLGAGDGETAIVAGVTVTGDTACLATNVIYRLDTESARSFLGQFVTLP